MIRFMNTFPMIINIKISIAFIEDNNDDDVMHIDQIYKKTEETRR